MPRPRRLSFLDQSVNRIQDWFHSLDFQLSFPQMLGLALALGTALVLRSETEFKFQEAARFFAFAFVSVVPLGGIIVELVLHDLPSKSVRAALIGITGYAASVTVGFLLGSSGVQWAYLPLCVIALFVWLGLLYQRTRSDQSLGRRVVASYDVQSLGNSKSFWLFAVLVLLSVLVVMPLLAPRVHVTDDLIYDYSFVDAHFNLTHTLMFKNGAPMQVWPDLAGTQPVVYPDFHNFWMAQLTVWSGNTVESVYYVYAPLVMLVLNTLLLYAFGKSVTGSPWGGLVAAGLGYVILVPNPYEPNFFMRDVEVPKWVWFRTHFLEFASGPSYGVGWQLLTGTALSIWLATSKQTVRIQVGALTVGCIMLVAMVRIRPHFFVAMAPTYFLILAWLLFRQREWRLLIPAVVFAVFFGAVFLESTGAHYNTTGIALGIAYGAQSDLLIQSYLPFPVNQWVTYLPGWIVPLAAICLYVVIRLSGAAFTLVIGYRVLQWGQRKSSVTAVDRYLWTVLGFTVVVASLLVLPSYVDVGGNWGGQALFIVPRIILLLAVTPLYVLLRQIYRHSAWVRRHAGPLAFGSLLVMSLVSYRGANATLHQQASRAYVSTTQERKVYNWIKANTPPDAVVATDPRHRVNAFGETILELHFLTAMTNRAAYLQKEIAANEVQAGEIAKRHAILLELFSSTNPARIRELLRATNIDYLLVFADTPSRTDFSCCMKRVFGTSPRVYHVIRDSP